MSDKDFKENFGIIEHYEIDSSELLLHNEKNMWRPDLVFENKDKTHIIICEHSSTGDRKAHIGEMVQFLTYVLTDKSHLCYSFFLFLDGKSKHSPNVTNERERLNYYYSKLITCPCAIRHIKDMRVIDFDASLISNENEYSCLRKKGQSIIDD